MQHDGQAVCRVRDFPRSFSTPSIPAGSGVQLYRKFPVPAELPNPAIHRVRIGGERANFISTRIGHGKLFR
jgi:hypothetical protein